MWRASMPVLLGVACLASAAEPPPPKASDVLKPEGAREIASPMNDRFALRASYFPAAVDTQIRWGDAGLLGTELSAEDDLGLRSRDDQGRIELTLRLRDRNRLRFDYFKLTRKGDEVLTRNVIFGDEIFIVSDRVTSLLDWRTLNFTYLYSVFRNQRFEMGAGLGIHILDGEVAARVPARQIREQESAAAPFPSLALDATWRFARRFSVSGRVNYISADLDESSGLVSDYHLDLQYRWRPNFAVGVGYTGLETRVDVVDDDESGRFSFDVRGPEVFFRASF